MQIKLPIDKYRSTLPILEELGCCHNKDYFVVVSELSHFYIIFIDLKCFDQFVHYLMHGSK